MSLSIIWSVVVLVVVFAVLVKVSIDDITKRTVKHRYLFCLAVLLLSSWWYQPNIQVFPICLVMLIVGFLLHYLNVLGAGDTKLLVVISFGVRPEFISLMLYGIALFGGLMAFGYLLIAIKTSLSKARAKGVPFAVPICLSGYLMVLLSYLSRLS